jgi:REP element-mobilizing transposase RayT
VAVYHVVSRVVDRRFVFGEGERRVFRRLLARQLAFSGLECVTFCLMSNHFHLLVVVPDGEVERGKVTDEELMERLGQVYGAAEVGQVRMELERLRGLDDGGLGAEAFRRRFLRRMYDLPRFVHELKLKFSKWYNREYERRGTLWEERYRSVLVEGGGATEAVAAYIDLNPVRAGLVDDPKDFRWSGYGEAVAGVAASRAGIARAVDPERSGWSWEEVQAVYRQLLYGMGVAVDGGEEGARKRRGFRPEEVEEVLAAGGRLPLAQALRCRVRYFSDGLVLGSRAFVESVFLAKRERFGARRRTGARPMRYADWGGMCSMRDLRKQVVDAGGDRAPV